MREQQCAQYFTNVNADLENVHGGMFMSMVKSKKLPISIINTECMLIGSKQKLSPMTVSPTPAIDNFPVTQVSTAKSLEVTIDDNPKWG